MIGHYDSGGRQEPDISHYDLISTRYRLRATAYYEVPDGERVKTFDDFDKAVRFARKIADRENAK